MNPTNGIQNKGRTSMLSFANGPSQVSEFSFCTPATLVVTAAVSLGLLNQTAQSEPKQDQQRYGVGMQGEVRDPETLTQFDYVNPDAPRGVPCRLALVA